MSTEHLLCDWPVLDSGDTDELGAAPASREPRVQAEEQLNTACPRQLDLT